MTTLLLFLAFALLFVPLLETIWDPLWRAAAGRWAQPRERLRLLRLRLLLGLLGGGALSGMLLWLIMTAPRSHPILPAPILTCLGHSFDHGPGVLTHVFITVGVFGLALITVALFYPLPTFPPGERRPDLEEALSRYGVSATVELLDDVEPGCWSETTPHPRVLLLGGIEEVFEPEELEAVLCHEAGHLSCGDHLARVWIRAYRRLLFFFRGAQVLFEEFVHEQERRADDQVLSWRPDLRLPLERALVRLATGDFELPIRSTPLGALGHAVWSVQQRVIRLRGEVEERSRPPLDASSWWSLLATTGLILLAVSDPGACTLHCMIDSLP